jgi:transcriptional regulator with XRE-family HTH domain
MADFFVEMGRVGDLKRSRLGGRPSDRQLAHAAGVSPDTIGAWLRGDRRFPQSFDPLRTILEGIRAEADQRDILRTSVDGTCRDTVAELLAEEHLKDAYQGERRRRTQAARATAERHQAQGVSEREERRAELPDRTHPARFWTAQRLGVHPAVSGPADQLGSNGFVLPLYVPRPHDTQLRECLIAAVGDGARPMLVVVQGTSCTGKTRTAYEALQHAVPHDFDLLSPVDAAGLLAALAGDLLGTRTVLWLNEAQKYLQGATGEAAAAALLRRLDGDGPLVVIACLWPESEKALTKAPVEPDDEDQHHNSRALLSQAIRIYVPDSFDDELAAVRAMAGQDRSLATVMEIGTADVAQTLAAAPDLVKHYEHPAGEHGIYGKALISAAMDAHRLQATGPLPFEFLEAAAHGYLNDAQRATASPDDWFTGALAYARTRIKNVTMALQDVPQASGMGAMPGVVRLADYLQQHGRLTRQPLCPPATFWDAAVKHLSSPDDLNALAYEANQRGRFRHGASLLCAAADAGAPYALLNLAETRRDSGDLDGAERLYRAAASADNEAAAFALQNLAWLHEEAGDRPAAERFARQAADAGNPGALLIFAQRRDDAEEWTEAERLFRAAAEAGDIGGMIWKVMVRREQAGDRKEAERIALQEAAAGRLHSLSTLAAMRKESGRRKEAERLYRVAAEAGDLRALSDLALMRRQAGAHKEAEQLYRTAVEAAAGDADDLLELGTIRQKAGDRKECVHLFEQAAAAGSIDALGWLAMMRELAGRRQEAENLARQAAHVGDPSVLCVLAQWRHEAGDRERAESLAREAANAGDPSALRELASMMKWRDQNAKEAERLYKAAADFGDSEAMWRLAKIREAAGAIEKADSLVLQAAEAGHTNAVQYMIRNREKAGNMEAATSLARQALDSGHTDALPYLIRTTENAGNTDAAWELVRQAADAGETKGLRYLSEIRGEEDGKLLLRYGLEANGSPAKPWPFPEPRLAAIPPDSAPCNVISPQKPENRGKLATKNH